MNKSTDIADDPYLRHLASKSIAFLALSFFLVLALGYFLRDPITYYAGEAVTFFGPLGIFFGVLGSDAFGLPIPPSTVLFASVAAGAPAALVLLLVSTASLLGGTTAYFVGPFIGKLPILRTVLERFRPRGELLYKRWGTWTVLIAALTPLPFAPFCWLAGIYKMPFKRFVSAAFVRAPRMLVYYAIFVLGWTTAAA